MKGPARIETITWSGLGQQNWVHEREVRVWALSKPQDCCVQLKHIVSLVVRIRILVIFTWLFFYTAKGPARIETMTWKGPGLLQKLKIMYNYGFQLKHIVRLVVLA